MEINAVKRMFIILEELYDAKYTVYIGDMYSKTYKGILNINIYGEEITIKKISA